MSGAQFTIPYEPTWFFASTSSASLCKPFGSCFRLYGHLCGAARHCCARLAANGGANLLCFGFEAHKLHETDMQYDVQDKPA
jgi:hypothetical protein